MVYYPESDSHIRIKVKVVLDLTGYVTKKELECATGVHTTDLAATKDFVALKAEVNKLDLNKLVKVPTSLNNLETKVDDLGVGKLKTDHVDLKKLYDAVDNEVDKNTKLNPLNTKINTMNQYNTDKQNLEKILRVTTSVLNKNIKEVDKKIPELSGSVKKIDYDAKSSYMERKHITTSDYIKFTSDILDAKIK